MYLIYIISWQVLTFGLVFESLECHLAVLRSLIENVQLSQYPLLTRSQYYAQRPFFWNPSQCLKFICFLTNRTEQTTAMWLFTQPVSAVCVNWVLSYSQCFALRTHGSVKCCLLVRLRGITLVMENSKGVKILIPILTSISLVICYLYVSQSTQKQRIVDLGWVASAIIYSELTDVSLSPLSLSLSLSLSHPLSLTLSLTLSPPLSRLHLITKNPNKCSVISQKEVYSNACLLLAFVASFETRDQRFNTCIHTRTYTAGM